MKTIEQIIKDRFYVKDTQGRLFDNMAYGSLRASFMSYFRTAEDMELYIKRLHHNDKLTDEKIKSLHNGNYIMDSCDAVLHFQHFIELFLKDILSDISEFLVYDSSKHIDILYKMSQSIALSEEEKSKIYVIECSDAIKRIEYLQKEGKLPAIYKFIDSQAIALMKRVNELRNSIAHRGARILAYEDLDILFAYYLIPFAKQVSALPSFRDVLSWGLNINASSINPYDDIETEFRKPNPDTYKVAILKRLASSAYRNVLDKGIFTHLIFGDFYRPQIQKAERIARDAAEYYGGAPALCPVCGCNTMVLEPDSDDYGKQFVYEARCTKCHFTLDSDMVYYIEKENMALPHYNKKV